MIMQVFPPNLRACKFCERLVVLYPGMKPGQRIKCKCRAKGVLAVFPCADPGCDCGGYISVKWEGVDYGERRDEAAPVIESFLKALLG